MSTNTFWENAVARAGRLALGVAICWTAATTGFATVAAEPAVVVAGGPPLVRRLTESQYRATIADIFGADTPVVGRFERGLRSDGLIAVGTGAAGLSPFSLEQYDVNARAVAASVLSAERRDEFVPCEVSDPAVFDQDCAGRFIADYGLRLFRRPLAASEVDLFLSSAQGAQEQLGDFYSALEFALAGMLISPDFLLRIERAVPDSTRPEGYRLDAWSSATRLSYFLTGSAPDEELLAAAAQGQLETEEGLQRQVDRLMMSPQFASAVREFFADMLYFDLFNDLAKDSVIYPAFNSEVAADSREQTLRTITSLLLDDKGDYRDLFTTRSAPLTRSLGMVYRMPVAVRNGWSMGEFPAASGRAGIQSQVSFLALHSHPGRSSPTLRGKAMREIFLCQNIPDPPADVDFTGIDDISNPAMPTARDRLVAHRTQPACQGCHILMDPLGLTLENFDGLGIFRTKENGAVIDVSGSLDGREFQAAAGLGQALHDHPQTPRCLVDKLYRSAVGRASTAPEKPFLDQLNQSFAATGYRFPELIRTLVTSPAFFAVTGYSTEQEMTDASAASGDNI